MQEHWSGLPFPSPGDLPNPEIKPTSPAWQVDSLPLGHLRSPQRVKDGLFQVLTFISQSQAQHVTAPRHPLAAVSTVRAAHHFLQLLQHSLPVKPPVLTSKSRKQGLFVTYSLNC